ncbi:MAG TPA: hypothetical protein VFX60_11805 [Micromonospora sp.]|nr:hypothetical protein [Micromonospora sp.]
MERLLEPLRDEPLPPSAVDIGRALVAGRRRVRHRRLASAAAASCAVLALVGGITVIVAGEAPDGSRPPVAQEPTASPPPMPARAPAAFEPLHRYAAFGWLPDGLADSFVETGTDQLLLGAWQPMTAESHERSGVELRIVPAGHDIALADMGDFAVEGAITEWAGVTSAEAVNGRTARWNGRAPSSGTGAALRWEYAPNAWAEVIVRGGAAGADARATARRIAETLRYGVDEPVRLPFGIAGLPDPLRPMSVLVSTRTFMGIPSWEARVAYGPGERTTSGEWPLTVMALPQPSDTGDGANFGDPNGTLDGHPVRRSSMADGGKALQVYGVQGLYLELTTDDTATTRQLPDGLDGLFRSMTLYPGLQHWQ